MSDPVVKNDATKAIREANPALKLNRIMNCGNGHSINGIGDVPVPILQKGIFCNKDTQRLDKLDVSSR